MSLKERIKSEQRAISRITNNDLDCKNCIYRKDDSTILGNTSRCDKWKNGLKPDRILKGLRCVKKIKEKM